MISVGLGSWADDAYVGLLYPPGTPSKERLRTYATWFDRVEVNSTYYAIPAPKVVAGWIEQTPSSFCFDLKLPRNFSQSPAKSAAGDSMTRLIAAVQPLAETKRLGVFLLTLAPSFTPAKHRLDELDLLIEKLAPHPLAVEFRHRDWVDGPSLDAALDYFRKRKLIWVALDLPRLDDPSLLPPIDEVTHPGHAYVRLHGRNPRYLEAESAEERHHYVYSDKEIKELAARLQALSKQAKRVHVSVNTHAADFAPKAALALKEALKL